MEFNQGKIAINRSGRKVLQNTNANKKASWFFFCFFLSMVLSRSHGNREGKWACNRTHKQKQWLLDFMFSTARHSGLGRRCAPMFLCKNCHSETAHWFIFLCQAALTRSRCFRESSPLTSPNPIRHLMVQFYIKNIISLWPRMAIIFYPKQEAGSLGFHAGWPTYEVPLNIASRLAAIFVHVAFVTR